MHKSVLEFMSAGTEGRLVLLKDPEAAEAVRSFVGESVFADLRKMLARGGVESHLNAGTAPNLVFVPGVMGSLLDNKTRSGVWWLHIDTRNHLNGLALSPDGLSDADPNDRIGPFNVDFTYEPFLSAVLERDDFGHRTFAYDWRKMYSQSTKGLRDLILKLHEENSGKSVHIVAHSMGGLMVRATLMEFGDDLWPVLGRIAFIGTPHYGSPSIAGYLKNHLWGLETLAVLAIYLSREALRSLWGVLSLLPAPAGVYPGTAPNDNPKWTPAKSSGNFYMHPCANFNLYDVTAWDLDLDPGQAANLQRILTAVSQFHSDLHAWHRNPAELLQDCCNRMLMVAGVGYKSLFRMEYNDKLGGLWTSMDKVMDRVPGDPNRDGDGRVPLASAQLSRVATRYVKGVHGGLTNIPAVYNDVFRWLKGEPLTSLATTPDDAMGGHLSAGVDASDAPHLDGSAGAQEDDPGYWKLTGIPQLDRAEADKLLDGGGMPGFNLTRIL